ncbi:hypothetical protein OS493_028863 [Desmophyllum pertusum]|uniref:Uncharacterized protein n=1 Tax=Desmophyllum pertusum TaxID=174260 RepID=A0A9W9ZNQ8_9CNID|nr:hypothetical protein OS493_028863 [Desmophyllum pertusum]
MHLVVSLFILAFGVILINSASIKKNFKSSSVEMRDNSDDHVASDVQQDNRIPLVIARLFKNHGYCLRRLSSLAPGTPSGFKAWKVKYSSGYVAVADTLYLLFTCDENNAGRRRMRRSPSHATVPPPRPCINDTMEPTQSDDEE